MSFIPRLFTDTTSSVRRTQAMEQFNHGQFSHDHDEDPMRILGAENYLDGNTLSIAQSLTELAQQPAHDMTLGWRFDENEETRGTATPLILKARQADAELNRYFERRKSAGAQAKEKPRERSERAEEVEESQVLKNKRKRRISEEEDGGNEVEKKARGRPRLDTKDESAADRRRTQIRLAQRAYRNRKETAITSLEKQVEKLQSVAQEMNSVFIELYDLAVTKGLLQREPEFGHQLQSATQRFLPLARLAEGDEANTLEDSSSPLLNALALPVDAETHSERTTETQRQDSHRPLPEDERSSKLTTTSAWGYEITDSSADTAYTTHTQRWFEQLPTPPPPKSTHHEIVARATESNASFPSDMYHYGALKNSFQTDYHVNFAQTNTSQTCLPNQQSLMQLYTPYNPYLQPSLPQSYSHNETSFGRRLHRTAVQRGYALLLNPSCSPRTFERVFGLTLRLYPKEMIAEALRQVILRHKSEPLSRWDLPFVNLGGSGMHFHSTEEDRVRDGVLKVGTGRSIGPLTEGVSENMERYLLDNFRGNVKGYEGLWFDTNDVESYLKERGIHIPPNVEWLTIDLDKVNLADATTTEATATPPSAVSNGTTTTPLSPQTPPLHYLGAEQRQQNVQSVDESLDFFLAGMGNEYTTASHTAPFVAGSTQTFGLNWSGGVEQAGDKQAGDAASGAGFDFGASSPFLNNGFSETSSESQSPRLVRLNVTFLMEAILRKGICLGRAPGFRPSDVDKALRQTIQEAS